MHYTYILQSISIPSKTYIGFTSNLKTRLSYYNSGRSIHTSRYQTWKLHYDPIGLMSSYNLQKTLIYTVKQYNEEMFIMLKAIINNININFAFNSFNIIKTQGPVTRVKRLIICIRKTL